MPTTSLLSPYCDPPPVMLHPEQFYFLRDRGALPRRYQIIRPIPKT